MQRDDLEALRARYDSLPPDAPERRQLRADFERLARHRRLPLLDDLRIATPCRESWDDMMGDHRVRFCTRCAKNVFDVSALTRAQALDLIETTEGRCCLRLFRRRDGTVLTADCPDARARKRRHRFILAATAAVAVSTALLWPGTPERGSGSLGLGASSSRPGDVRMGGILGILREAPSFGGTLEPFQRHARSLDSSVMETSTMGAPMMLDVAPADPRSD